MRNRTVSAAVLVMATLALGACSGSEKSLGDDNPADTTLSLEDFAAHWDGYIEAYQLASGSDRIRIVLDEDGNGTVLFGEGDPLAAPTDPNTEYPPDVEGEDPGAVEAGSVYEKIAYPVYDTRLEAKRLRLEIHPFDSVSDWCALQTPVYDAVNDTYGCVPNTGSGFDASGCYYLGDNDEHVPVLCEKLNLCLAGVVCACTESGCGGSENGPKIQLDGALDDDGETLEGTLVIDNSPRTVRLTRQ